MDKYYFGMLKPNAKRNDAFYTFFTNAAALLTESIESWPPEYAHIIPKLEKLRVNFFFLLNSLF